jgi:ketosteroid isomerase-like protein
MKPLTLLVTITALGLAASAFGQEEQATATPMQEQPSTTIQESPAATPAVETTPQAMEKPTPTATASPAAKAAKSATPAAAKAASPAAAPTGKKTTVEAALKDNENRWATAHGKAGAPIVEALVADDFIGVSSKGKIQNRRAMLAEMKKDRDTYTSAKNEKLDVHRYGNNVAVVVGKYRETGTDKDGKAFDRAYYFTDTWVERNGAWKCVASENMLAPK